MDPENHPPTAFSNPFEVSSSPTPSSTSTHSSRLLSLPLELRLQIYTQLFSNGATLTLRSLFIRTNYRNTFMTQQPCLISPAILATNRQIHAEARPILYAGPRWLCGCRVEALASQIGETNFALIRRMGVDVDDLDLVVECARRERQRTVHRGSGYAMQEIDVRVPPGMREVRSLGGPRGGLDFSCLEVLEVEGYQSAAMSSRGSHRVRVEALRLCELASQLVDFHPNLKVLLQRGGCWDGGADARDLTLGRVRWTFVKDVPTHLADEEEKGKGKSVADNESRRGSEAGEESHVVDLAMIRSMLELMLREDERAVQSETSLPVAWTSSGTGRFNLYPYLQMERV